MPNFIEIGQASLEIGVGRKKKFPHTHIHTYILTRVALRSARGATNETRISVMQASLTAKASIQTLAMDEARI